MENITYCPQCGFEDVVKNGRSRHGRQNYRCKVCGRQFCPDPAVRISDEVQKIVGRMIRAGESVGKIIDYTQVSAGYVYSRKRERERDAGR